MTTPNQTAAEAFGNSADLSALVGLGAFQLGSAAENWGQNVTDTFVRTLTAGAATGMVGVSDLAGFVTQFTAFLSALPLEALQWFQQFIPGSVASDFATITSAVEKIVGAFSFEAVLMLVADFESWVTGTFDLLQSIVNQILDLLNGVVITPLNDQIAGAKAFLANLLSIFEGIDFFDPDFDAVDSFNTLVKAILTPLFAVFSVTSVSDFVTAFTADVTSTASTATNIAALLTASGKSTLADLGALISEIWTALNQIGQVLQGGSVTAVDDSVQAFKDWWASAGSLIPGALTNISTLLSNVGEIGTDLTALFTNAGSANLADLGSLIATINSILTQLGTIFSGGTVSSPAGSPVTQLQTWWSATGTNLPTAITNAGTAVSNFATLLSNSGAGTVAALGTLISTLNTMITQISGIFHGDTVTAVNSTVQQIKDWWTAVGGSLPTAITNAASALSGLSDAVSAAGQTTPANLGTAVSTAAAQAQGTVDAVANAINASGGALATATGQTVSDVESAVSSLVSTAVQNLQGVGAGIYGVADWAASLSGVRSTTTTHTTQIAEVYAALEVAPSSGGVDVTVDFTGVANQSTMGSPAALMLPGTGPMGVTSGEAILQTTPQTSFTYAEYFPTLPSSPYVVAEVTLGSLHDLLNATVVLAILLRANTSGLYGNDTYLWIVSGGGSTATITLGVSNAGATHTLASVSLPSLSGGAVFEVILGDRLAGNEYVYEVLLNGTSIIGPVTDSSHYSDVTNFHIGIWQYSATAGKLPPGVAKVRYFDNAPTTGPRPFEGLPAPDDSIADGGLYFPSDTGLVLRKNGAAWDRVMGGTLTAFTPPPAAASLTTTLLGTATVTDDLDSLLITAPNASAIRAAYEAIPLTAGIPTPYSFTVYIEASLDNYVNQYSGIVLTDGMKFTIFGPTVNSSGLLEVMVSNAATYTGSQSSASYNSNVLVYGVPHWYRVVDDGTYKNFYYSWNGVDWTLLYQISRTTYLTATSIGVGIKDSGGGTAYLRTRSWLLTTS